MKSVFSVVTRYQRSITIVALICTVVLPLLAIIFLGFLWLWQTQYLPEFLIAVAVLNVCVFGGIALYRWRSGSREAQTPALIHLVPPAEWPPYDLYIWQQGMQRIADQNLDDTLWTNLRSVSIEQLRYVARAYYAEADHAEYQFTVPELLLLVETVSARYRQFVLQNIPLINDIKVANAMVWGSRARKGYDVYHRHRNIIRTARAILAPAEALYNEARDLVTGKLFDQLNARAQRNLKSALLENLTEVAIDLYSGRLRLSEAELAAYEAHKALTIEETPIPPLRILVVGQINAGKSTLINRLCEASLTDVDTLPSTASFNVIRLAMADGLTVDLVDSPGLDGSAKNERMLLAEAIEADLVLWVCQANQPAKSLDRELIIKWQFYFDNDLRRKRPPILLVTTHNDRLLTNQIWTPPYDLTDANNPVSSIMLEAYHFSRDALGLTPDTTVLPVACPPDDTAYNIDLVKLAIQAAGEEARASQKQRHREQGDGFSAKRVLQQTSGAFNEGMGLLRKRKIMEPPSSSEKHDCSDTRTPELDD